MPQVSFPQTVFLLLVIGAFVLFGVTLFVVSMTTTFGAKRDEAPKDVERKVIPARRAGSAH